MRRFPSSGKRSSLLNVIGTGLAHRHYKAGAIGFGLVDRQILRRQSKTSPKRHFHDATSNVTSPRYSTRSKCRNLSGVLSAYRGAQALLISSQLRPSARDIPFAREWLSFASGQQRRLNEAVDFRDHVGQIP
jgi:hypothetical protein